MYQALIFLPLLGAFLAGLFGTKLFKKIGSESTAFSDHDHNDRNASSHHHEKQVMWPLYLTTVFLFISAILAWIGFADFLKNEPGVIKIHLLSWIDSGVFKSAWSLRIDMITAVMLVVVTSVSALVHLYSLGYMSHDPHCSRFFAYLSLFTFAMLMLVTADNLLQIFFGWEGVGLASYLLIGFWYEKPSANAAAMKAFIVNRVGDFGFALGIFGCFAVFQTIDFDIIFAAAPTQVGKTIPFLNWHIDILTLLCLLFFMGAMGKSAQFLLHTWLPDAMEGPTPVSALIHAATMVTAGVFLIARLSPLYELAPFAKNVIIMIGAITAFFAASVGLVQNDIKRVIAYSTCSQLGYMFVAMGLGAYGVGMFHLFTHAFFKALLFLGAGSVIHAVSGEQDMRKMGGLASHTRLTYVMMLIGTLSLTGFPFMAGYYSKDAIIEAAFASHAGPAAFAFFILLIVACLTSFYSWRLIFMSFHGSPRASKHVMDHVHESSNVMLVPLYVLAVGAVFAGFAFHNGFIGHDYKVFWHGALANNKIMEELHEVPSWVGYVTSIAMISGLGLAMVFYLYRPTLPGHLRTRFEPLYRFLLNKWYFDEIYDRLFVRSAQCFGRFLWKFGDGWLIDGFGPNGVSARVVDLARLSVSLQTGYLYHYAFVMLIGVAALVTWFSFGGA